MFGVMLMKEKQKIFIMSEDKTPKYANTYRVGFSESEIIIDFGQIAPGEDSDKEVIVNVTSRVTIPPDILASFVFALFSPACYEEKFGKNIGGFSAAFSAGKQEKKRK
jgi:hypothetical protein